jgi:hypothetical protein
MSRVVYPEFEHGRRYVPARPNILRRVISRYQLVELTVIIGAIFLLWGGSSIERLPGLMTATQPLACPSASRSSTATRSGAAERYIGWSASTRRNRAPTPDVSTSALCRGQRRIG